MKSKLTEFTPEQHTAMLNKINEMFLSGVSRLSIRELIKSYSPLDDLSEADVDELLSNAAIMLEESTPLDKNRIKLIHISHYERVFNYFDSINHVEGKNKALRAKEKLLCMVSGSKLTLNNRTSVEFGKNVQYDENRLSDHQRRRLGDLMERLRIE